MHYGTTVVSHHDAICITHPATWHLKVSKQDEITLQVLVESEARKDSLVMTYRVRERLFSSDVKVIVYGDEDAIARFTSFIEGYISRQA